VPARGTGTGPPVWAMEAVMTRETFDGQLQAVLGALADMTATAGEAITTATDALLQADLSAAADVAELDQRLDAARRAVEERTFEMLARQQPVATDLRALVTAIRAAADVDRMGSLAHHVAKVACLRHPAIAVPENLVPIFREMGTVARRMTESAGAVLVRPDAADAARLDVDDDTMDELHRRLFRHLLGDWIYGVEAAIDVALLGRYYERFADHAVAIAGTVVYLVTGTMPEERGAHLG
jgi:phosphate transport system protein